MQWNQRWKLAEHKLGIEIQEHRPFHQNIWGNFFFLLNRRNVCGGVSFNLLNIIYRNLRHVFVPRMVLYRYFTKIHHVDYFTRQNHILRKIVQGCAVLINSTQIVTAYFQAIHNAFSCYLPPSYFASSITHTISIESLFNLLSPQVNWFHKLFIFIITLIIHITNV